VEDNRRSRGTSMKSTANRSPSWRPGSERARSSGKWAGLLIVAGAVLLVVSIYPGGGEAATAPSLGTAENFAVLAGSAVSNTGTTSILGDVGLSPTGGASITGLTCDQVTGTIYDTDGGYTGGGGGSTACLTTNPGLLTTAKNDLTTAYNNAAGQGTDSTVGTELGGTTLTAGVYDSAAGTFGITGVLTLDGEDNPDAVFIFKMATTLTSAAGSSVNFIRGAQACNVFWQVGSSATLGANSSFSGNILAATSITLTTGATVNGRLLAMNGAVTLDTNTIIIPTCVLAPTSTPLPPETATQVAAATATQAAAATATQAAAATATATQVAAATATQAAVATATQAAAATATQVAAAAPTVEAAVATQAAVATATQAAAATATQVVAATATQAAAATATQVAAATATQAAVPVSTPTPTTPVGVPRPPQVGDAGLLQDTKSARQTGAIVFGAASLLGALTLAALSRKRAQTQGVRGQRRTD
jgi:hypothetical protein